MLICGMTGSIATGKSTIAAMFRRRGIPVFGADAMVHQLYQGRAVPLIEAEFPGATENGRVDRNMLSQLVFGKPERLARLEKLVHGLLAEEEQKFRATARQAAYRMILLDIPLLFETGAERRVDLSIVVTVDQAVQKARAMARPGMSEVKLQAILDRQMPDGDKRRRAHFLIDTGYDMATAERQVEAILRATASML